MSNVGLTVVYNIPKPRQEWVHGKFVIHHERTEEAWVELYNDLVFVVLLSKLGTLMESSSADKMTVFHVSVLFWIMCLTRQAIDEYANRFYIHDLVHKLLYLIYSSGVFVVVMNINCGAESELNAVCEFGNKQWSGLAIGLLITRTVMIASTSFILYLFNICFLCYLTSIESIVVYSCVMYHHASARKQFSFDMVRWSISIFIFSMIIILRGKESSSAFIDLLLIGLAAVIEMSGWIVSRSIYRQYFVIPINLELMQSRWGVWVMIVVRARCKAMLHYIIFKCVTVG